MGHFGHTYLPMSDVFYTMPITLVRFLLRYLPTPKLDVLYERSLFTPFYVSEVGKDVEKKTDVAPVEKKNGCPCFI